MDVAFDDGTVDTVRIVGIDTPETGSTDERLQEYEGIDDGPALKTEADKATDYGVYPFLTNVIDALGTGTGPVIVDGGHGQFASDFAVSAEDTAYYLRYLEGQSPGDEAFIGLEGVVEVASDPGPDLLDGSDPAARGLIISTPTSALTDEERSAVASYADAGGVVVLLGSAADTDAVGNFDPLLDDLDADVGFTDTAVTDSSNNLDGNPSNPTTTNFDETGGLFSPFTPGSGSAAPDVTITELDDGEEYVVIENQGSTDADLDGWTLSDSDGDVFGFPADTLSLGETVVVTTSQTAADAPPETDYTYDWGSPEFNGFV